MFRYKVYAAVRQIPRGYVATYAQIGEMVSSKKAARAVGNALHINAFPDSTPCYRVVNAKGELAKNFGCGGIDEQKRRLEADGIEVIAYKVDLKKYQWNGSLSFDSCDCTVEF